MSLIRQAVVLCGGLGTRLRPFTHNTPKPMVIIDKKPFLEFLLEKLSEEGIKKFVLLTGYLGEQIEEYFKDGSKWGWQIQYSKGPVDWDTAKRIWESRNKLDESFLLMYSDNFTTINLNSLINFHKNFNRPLTITLSRKNTGNIKVNSDGKIEQYDQFRSESGLDYVDIGFMIAKRDSIFEFYDGANSSLSEIIKIMVKHNLVNGYIHHDHYYSISDPERLYITKKYLSNSKIILLDRDGIINNRAPKGEYITTWEKFQWAPGIKKGLKKLSTEGFQFIVISNQAGIARGRVKQNDLDNITNQMEKELLLDSIHILKTYVCPHHWEDDCICRKPKPGLFYEASKEFLFRLDKTIFIGDDSRDCQAAFNSGCKSVFIGNQEELSELDQKEHPISMHIDFKGAVSLILEYFKRS